MPGRVFFDSIDTGSRAHAIPMSTHNKHVKVKISKLTYSKIKGVIKRYFRCFCSKNIRVGTHQNDLIRAILIVPKKK